MILNISCICCPLNSVIRCCITWISCSITGTKMVWYWLLQFLWLVSNRKIYTHFVFQWCNVAHGIRHTLTSVFFWTTTPKSALDHEHVWHQALIVTKVCWPFLSPPSLVFVWAFAILGSYEAEEKIRCFTCKVGNFFPLSILATRRHPHTLPPCCHSTYSGTWWVRSVWWKILTEAVKPA